MRNRVNNTGGVTYDQVFRAIGDPHRLQILTLLREKELSAGEILKMLDVVQSTLSHHMKSLVDAGVVTASRHGKWTYYSLNTEVLTDSVSFLGEFTEGTRERAQFVRSETDRTDSEANRGTGSTSKKPEEKAIKEENTGSSKKARSAGQKAVSSADSREEHAQEEKKKSKKGKKGKKSKK